MPLPEVDRSVDALAREISVPRGGFTGSEAELTIFLDAAIHSIVSVAQHEKEYPPGAVIGGREGNALVE